MCGCMCVCARSVHMHRCVRAHARTHARLRWNVSMCMCACAHVCMSACVRLLVCACVCAWAGMCHCNVRMTSVHMSAEWSESAERGAWRSLVRKAFPVGVGSRESSKHRACVWPSQSRSPGPPLYKPPFSKVCTPVQHRRRNLRPSFLKRMPEPQKMCVIPETAFCSFCSLCTCMQSHAN